MADGSRGSREQSGHKLHTPVSRRSFRKRRWKTFLKYAAGFVKQVVGPREYSVVLREYPVIPRNTQWPQREYIMSPREYPGKAHQEQPSPTRGPACIAQRVVADD